MPLQQASVASAVPSPVSVPGAMVFVSRPVKL